MDEGGKATAWRGAGWYTVSWNTRAGKRAETSLYETEGELAADLAGNGRPSASAEYRGDGKIAETVD